jgi:hypothetical protein
MTTDRDIARVTVPTLQRLVARGQVWTRVAAEYGVTNPQPPWKSSLDGMCDALDDEGSVLPPLTRRDDEDLLSKEVYGMLPYPESQLVALAHSMVGRGLIDEDALARRLDEVRYRLVASEG